MSSSSSSSLPIFLPLAGPLTASSSPPLLLRRQCACGEMTRTGGRTMHETAIVRAAHVQTPQHQQWEETVLSTLPCHTPLTLYAKHEEEEEENEEVEKGEDEPQECEQEVQQPCSHSPITNTPLKAKDDTTEEDGTYITPRRLPFDCTKQTVPSVLRSFMLKAAAAAAAACHQPSSSSPPSSPPRPLRPRSHTSTFTTATMQSSSSLSSSPKAPRRLPFAYSSSFLSLNDDDGE